MAAAKRSRSTAAKRRWHEAVETGSLLVVILFLVELVDWILPLRLDVFGVHPRQPIGLLGILFSPLLHLNAAHLMANATPLFILLIFLFWDGRYRPEETLTFIWIGSGLGTWLLGRGGSIHIGASGLVYGLVAYLVVAGWMIGSWRAVIVAVLVFFLFGGIFYGVLPQEGTMSWEGHLSGAIAGFLAAWKQRR